MTPRYDIEHPGILPLDDRRLTLSLRPEGFEPPSPGLLGSPYVPFSLVDGKRLELLTAALQAQCSPVELAAQN